MDPLPGEGCGPGPRFTVLQPATVRDEAVLQQVRDLHPELLVVVAYGKILPRPCWTSPPWPPSMSTAASCPATGGRPINWAILRGDTETGVTVQHLGEELDAGDIILVKKTPIDPEEDALQLTRRLADLGAEALSQAVKALADGTAPRTPQGEAVEPYAAMLSREMSPIDWNKPAQTIVNQIRGLIPWPCANGTGGKRLKVYRAKWGSPPPPSRGRWSPPASGASLSAGDGRAVLPAPAGGGEADGGRRLSAGPPIHV